MNIGDMIYHDEIEERIMELQRNLVNTDYKTLKYIEGELSQEEYDISCKEREEWREEIRKLEMEKQKHE